MQRSLARRGRQAGSIALLICVQTSVSLWIAHLQGRETRESFSAFALRCAARSRLCSLDVHRWPNGLSRCLGGSVWAASASLVQRAHLCWRRRALVVRCSSSVTCRPWLRKRGELVELSSQKHHHLRLRLMTAAKIVQHSCEDLSLFDGLSTVHVLFALLLLFSLQDSIEACSQATGRGAH